MPDLTGRRFCFTTYYWRPYRSGLTLVVARMAEALAAAGADVEAIVARHDRALPRTEEIRGVRVRRLGVAGRLDRGLLVPRLVASVAATARRADVVVLALPMAEAGAIAAGLGRHTRLCVHHVCDPQTRSSGLGRLLIPLVNGSARLALRRADLVLTLSADYAAQSPVAGRHAARALAIPPPVDHAAFTRPSDVAERRADEPPRVGFLGRLTHEKGLDRLVRAADRLQEPVRLVLAGQGDGVAGGGEQAALKRLAKELGVDLELPGPVAEADLPAFYASLDVFALPSVNSLEAWGMVQAEAMLCGTPVVASALPGVREIVRRTGMGELVEPGDVDDLARGLRAVLSDRGSYLRPREHVVASLGLARALPDAVAALGRLASLRR